MEPLMEPWVLRGIVFVGMTTILVSCFVYSCVAFVASYEAQRPVAPCIDSVIVMDPANVAFIGHVDTRDLCGGGRYPGKPEARDGLLVVTCACPRKELR